MQVRNAHNWAPKYRYCPHCSNQLSTKMDQDGCQRQVCCACNWVYYPHSATSAAGILVDSGKVLLVQRGSEPFAGSWHLPSGFVGYGEHPARAIEREFLEETALRVEALTVVDMFISEDDPRELGHLALFFEVGKSTGTVSISDGENISFGWFDVQNLPPIVLRNHAIALANYFHQ